MGKRILIVFFVIFLIACVDTLSVKNTDEYLGVSKLISARYHKDSGGFLSNDEEHWVLNFENGMTVTLDLNQEKYKPKYFEVGKEYEIYTDGTYMKVKLASK